MTQTPWRATDDGLLLTVRLTPKGRRDALEGIETLADGKAVLKARVRTVPEDGKANAALIKLVAETLACPISMIAIAAGATSRIKTLRIKGNPQHLMLKLEESVAP